jgi:hypothetical protein
MNPADNTPDPAGRDFAIGDRVLFLRGPFIKIGGRVTAEGTEDRGLYTVVVILWGQPVELLADPTDLCKLG